MNPYNYMSADGAFNTQLAGQNGKWRHYTVDFPSAVYHSDPRGSLVSGEYYQPVRQGRAPLAILLHGMGDHSMVPCKLLARSLVTRGIACFALYLMVHSRRVPEEARARFPVLSPQEWFDVYQTSVVDVRQVIDWSGSRDEIAGSEIAVIGISFGGFISAVAMGIDDRIKSGVFIVSGGNGEKINHNSRLSSITRAYRKTEAEYRHIQDAFQHYLDEVEKKGFDKVVPSRRGFLTDPMTFAYRLRSRPVLMLNARWDEAIPREATIDFWEASGRPKIIWFPATHSTIWLWYPYISRKIVNFLRSSWGTGQPGGMKLR